MGEVVAHKPHNTTIGVLDKNLQLHEDVQSVTFKDKNDTVHTVYAHVNGPFGSPEDIVKAWENGALHVFESHEAAIEHWALKEGAQEFVKLLESQSQSKSSQPSQSGGGF